MDTHLTLAPLGYSTLLPSNKWAILYVELLWAKQIILNDHSPSIKLFKNKQKQMIKSLIEIAQRHLTLLQLWSKR